MRKPFLNRDIPPKCRYCKHGSLSAYSHEVFCIKHGVTDPENACRKFRYDILKRTPRHPSIGTDYSSADFKL